MSLLADCPLRFPSVLLQPLGHLSVFRINNLRAIWQHIIAHVVEFLHRSSISFAFNEFDVSA